jgi:ATP-dependent protease ClpP protease subunit
VRKTIWELKQAAEPDTLEMYLYESIQPDGYDWWSDEKIISETSANHFREELGKHQNIKQINLYVNSYGGDVKEAMGIHAQLKRHPANVTAYVDGFAASAASFILTACDKVVMAAPTMQMIHDMWNVSIGNAADHRKNADDLDAIMAGNRQAYLAKSGGKLNEKQLKALMQAETWLNAEQCMEFGLCDEISDKAVDMAVAEAALKAKSDTLAQKSRQLVAQLRQMAEPPPPPPVEPTAPADPPAPPADPAPKENTPLRLFAALGR